MSPRTEASEDVLDREFDRCSAPQRSRMGYVCPYCGGERMPRCRAVRHATTKRHRRAVMKANPTFGSRSDRWRLPRSPPLPRDDDDDDMGDRPRKRRPTEASWTVSDTERTEDKTLKVMHSRPRHSTPYFDRPSNPPIAQGGQDGQDGLAATISARLDQILEARLAPLINVLPRLIDVLTAPSLDDIRSDVGSAAKIFVSTPFLCKHHGAAPMFAAALRKGGLVSESDVKHRAFYKALMRHLPSALMQGRSELEDHVKRAQGDSALLGTTMKSWYKNLEVTITDEHVCWWRVLWQAVKQPDRKAMVEADLTGNETHKTANVPGSRSNSFAEKVNRVSSTLAEIAVDAYLEGQYKHGREFDHQRFLTDQLAPVMPRHSGILTSQPGRRQNPMQISCLEVVDNPDHEISFASLVESCLQADKEATQNSKPKKKKKKAGD